MDGDGYPTEQDIETIQHLDAHKFRPGAEIILELFEASGCGSGKFEGPDKMGNFSLTLHTGGWSGCEDMIAALENADPAESLWWMMYWHSTTRGGHYVFKGRG